MRRWRPTITTAAAPQDHTEVHEDRRVEHHPDSASGDGGDRKAAPRAEGDRGEADHERGAGERAEVLVPEERDLALPGPRRRRLGERVVDVRRGT